MFDTTIVEGRDVTGGPDWTPLERLLPLALCRRFMYMQRVELDDGGYLHAYKHSDTRSYLVLDDDASAWERLGRGRYRRMRRSEAIEFVFGTWWVLHHADEEQREALKSALSTERTDCCEAVSGQILPCSPASPFRWLPDDPWPRELDDQARPDADVVLAPE